MDLGQGDIYWAFDSSGDKRPFIVISRRELNRGDYFLAVPFTSGRLESRKSLPTCVFFKRGTCGLPKDCVAQADAVTQLRKSYLVLPLERVGALSPELLRRVLAALAYAVGADWSPPATPVQAQGTTESPRLDL